ncbi:hypothetical protein [Burkholderia sp. F1]|uniref:hypothetical protein n=1 Tax=Burkholderia sp. F1 TaxID=3366817 RepID=UPI003D717C2C
MRTSLGEWPGAVVASGSVTIIDGRTIRTLISIKRPRRIDATNGRASHAASGRTPALDAGQAAARRSPVEYGWPARTVPARFRCAPARPRALAVRERCTEPDFAPCPIRAAFPSR